MPEADENLVDHRERAVGTGLNVTLERGVEKFDRGNLWFFEVLIGAPIRRRSARKQAAEKLGREPTTRNKRIY